MAFGALATRYEKDSAAAMAGYVPHREAFERGGHETTFAGSRRLAPEAGDMLADCALGPLEEALAR